MTAHPISAAALKPLLLALSISVILAFAAGLSPAKADLGTAASSVPSASLVGKGRMTYLGFRVFDAELYAPGGKYSPSRPFALKLTYLRNFTGTDIAKSSEQEMRKQGASNAKLATWRKQMDRIFPNVSKGQSITGVRTVSGSTVFYKGNRKIGSISDPGFTKSFFSIWLGNKTRNPGLRAKLVGAGA